MPQPSRPELSPLASLPLAIQIDGAAAERGAATQRPPRRCWLVRWRARASFDARSPSSWLVRGARVRSPDRIRASGRALCIDQPSAAGRAVRRRRSTLLPSTSSATIRSIARAASQLEIPISSPPSATIMTTRSRPAYHTSCCTPTTAHKGRTTCLV